jgi:iron complex outermembrane receptor protein
MVRFARQSFVGLSVVLPFWMLCSQAFAADVASPQTGEAVPVQATQSNSSGTSLQKEELVEIQVTGTQLIANGFQAPTPVTVFSADELTMSAPKNLLDALNQLPALAGSTGSKTGQGASGIAESGSFLNLRNLGQQRTLVLVDGHRITPATTTGAGDINLIPQALVSRVDVVTGGASAAYGSDAVAGVVNLILDNNFTGIKALVQGGESNYQDAQSNKEEFDAGAAFADNKGHFLASLSHSKQNPVYSQENRPWGSQGSGLLTIPGNTPLNLILPNVSQIASYGGLITSGPFANTQFLPGGVPAAYDPGGPRSSVNQANGTQQREYGNLSSLVETNNIFLRTQYEIMDNLLAFAQASWGESHNRYAQVYPFEFGATPFTIFSGNPFIPASIQSQMTAQGIPSFTLARVSRDFGAAYGDFLNDEYDFSTGLKGKFAGSWAYDVYLEHGQTRQIVHTDGNPNQQNLYAAADAVVDPASGRVACRVTLTNPGLYPGCTPIDLFGDGSPSQQAIDYVTGSSLYVAKLKQDVADVTIRGEPFSLTPAGPVSIAVGGEYRNESVVQTSDLISQEIKTATGIRGFPAPLLNSLGGWSLTNQQPIEGSYHIHEGFFEGLVPLLKDAPLAQSLDLNAAVRYTDYSTSGGVTTWKIGTVYKPVRDLLFRGTVSEDIRAANLSELFAANQQGQGGVSDDFNGGKLVTIFTSATGNLNLQPERAKTYTGGFVATPSWLPGFSASVDYWNISISGAIQTLSAQQTVDQCFHGAQVACDNIQRGADGNISRILLPFINFASVKTNGVDVEAGYRTSMSELHSGWSGDFDIRGLVSYISSLTSQVPGSAPVQTAGEVGISNNPKTQALIKATYNNGPLTLFAQEKYISAGVYNTTYVQGVTINDNHIPSVFYTDLTGQYRYNNFTLFLTVNNVFNRDPPVFPTVATTVWYQTNGSLYDVLGRYFTAGFVFKM